MANQLKKTRTITDKITVKGKLSEDGLKFSYLDEDKLEQEITIAECLKPFLDEYVDFSISLKTEGELPD